MSNIVNAGYIATQLSLIKMNAKETGEIQTHTIGGFEVTFKNNRFHVETVGMMAEAAIPDFIFDRGLPALEAEVEKKFADANRDLATDPATTVCFNCHTEVPTGEMTQCVDCLVHTCLACKLADCQCEDRPDRWNFDTATPEELAELEAAA